MIDVVCFKWGTKFGPEYVNKFYRAVQRNTTVEHNFICYTDDPVGVECETRPFLADLPFWWYIIGLTNPAHNHSDRTFYFDLDTIVTGNIDHLLSMDKPFATISDFVRPKGLQTAFIMWDKESGAKIWEYFTKRYQPEDYANLDCSVTVPGGTNQFLEEAMGVVDINKNPVPGAQPPIPVCRIQDVWPKQFFSFKRNIRREHRNQLPPDTRLVFFHGNPMPHEMHNLPWMKEHWV